MFNPHHVLNRLWADVFAVDQHNGVLGATCRYGVTRALYRQTY